MQKSDIQWPNWREVDTTSNTSKFPRNEKRVMVAAFAEPSNGQNAATELFAHGLSVRLLFESDLPKLQKLVRTPEHERRIADCTKAFERRLAEHRKRCKSDEEARATTGDSVEAIYAELYHEDIPPFRFAVVSDVAVDAPHTPEKVAEQIAGEQARQLGELVKALTSAIKSK